MRPRKLMSDFGQIAVSMSPDRRAEESKNFHRAKTASIGSFFGFARRRTASSIAAWLIVYRGIWDRAKTRMAPGFLAKRRVCNQLCIQRERTL